MDSSRTIEIEIPRVLSEFICYQVTHVDQQPIILHQEIVRPLVSGERGEYDASAISDLGNSLEDFENDVT